MKTWFTADWHLGEERLHLLGRPCLTSDEHITMIRDNHNALVAPEDLVYVIGDALYQKASKSLLSVLAQFNGRKVLLRGNHDRAFTTAELSPYFQEIHEEGKGLAITIENLACNLTHYPTCGIPDKFNLVGHIHGSWRVQKNMLNVGVDAHFMRPMLSTQIPFYHNAVCNIYDQDVWVHSHAANRQHDTRGKAGSYFSAPL